MYNIVLILMGIIVFVVGCGLAYAWLDWISECEIRKGTEYCLQRKYQNMN